MATGVRRCTIPVIWLLAAWLLANFIFIGLASVVAGGWYLGWEHRLSRLIAEMGLIQLPNLLLALGILRIANKVSWQQAWAELGWRWTGWRVILTGLAAFLLSLGVSLASNYLVGPPISYNLPGEGGLSANGLAPALGLMALILSFVVLTTFGEESMFRGLIQTQLSNRFGALVAILATALLFGLRHLPADLFYARAWNATPQMWLTRNVQLYSGALLFGLARHFGKSTWASWLMHLLTFSLILAGG